MQILSNDVNFNPSEAVEVDIDKQIEAIDFYTSANKTLAVQHAFSQIKKPENFKPSVLAQISIDTVNRSEAIQQVDQLFLKGIETYKIDLLNAHTTDMEISKVQRDTSMDFSYAVAKGTMNFANHVPNFPVFKYVVGPVFCFFGAIYGIVKQHQFVQEKINEEINTNRNRWINEVIIREEMRKEESVRALQVRAYDIMQEIQSMNDTLTLEDPLVEELMKLDELVHKISPETPIQLNDDSVSDYIMGKISQ